MKITYDELYKLKKVDNLSTKEIASLYLTKPRTIARFLRKYNLQSEPVIKEEITVSCGHCGKDTTNPKYCSSSCAAKETNKIPKRTKSKIKCLTCDNLTKDNRSTYCEECFKLYGKNNKSFYQNLTINDYIYRGSLKNLHKSSKFVHIRSLARSWFKDLTKLPCANCGYDKHVELCHIKAVSTFDYTTTIGEVNSEDNIIQLCPNCHWEFDNNLLDLEAIKSPQTI